jgi:leader peptidase (prepilin peptidase) / N-methyltransferase
MTELLLALCAGLLAGVGAQGSLRLPHYTFQKRAIQGRSLAAVALAAGTAAVAAWQGESLLSQVFLALWSLVFALIAVIDIETHFIPDRLILPATFAALLASFFDPRIPWRSALLGALAGFVVFYVIALIARGGFGMGDAKLAAFVGAVTGLVPLLYALLTAIFAGGAVALLLLLSQRAGRRSFMPYGPFLCLGGWLGMLPGVVRFWGLE